MLSTIAVGRGQYTPDADQTALRDEIKRLPIIQASATEDHAIHVAYQDDSSDSYSAYEVGVFTSDGVLFAIYSSSDLLISKSANASCLLTVDMTIDDLDVHDISFGDIEFAMGQATTENAGTVEIATQAEVDAGEDAYRVVTPATLAATFAMRLAMALAREGAGIETTNNALRPVSDNRLSLGTGVRRWKSIHVVTSVISTSDEREKDEIQAIPDKVLNAWERVNFKQFKFKAEPADIYFGVIAQDIIRAFEREGLNALDYGIVVHTNDRYAVRYNDCLVLEAACVRRRLARIETMLKEVTDV
jgi:hypothetical protein